MFSESEWTQAAPPSAPGPAAVSVNGNADSLPFTPFDKEAESWGDDDAVDFETYLDGRLNRLDLATMLLAVGLACIGLAMLVYVRGRQ